MKYLLIAFLLVSILITAGCVNQNNGIVTPIPTTSQSLSVSTTTIALSQTVDTSSTSNEPRINGDKFDRGWIRSDQDAVVYVLRWQMDDSINKNDFRAAAFYKTELLKGIHNYIAIDSSLTNSPYCDENCASTYPDSGHSEVAMALEKCLNEYDIKDKTDSCKSEWNNFNQSLKKF